MSESPHTTNPASGLHLPRILCLHGGGANGAAFSLQCRTIIHQLCHKFRFCFLNGPFTSEPAPDMIPTYKHFENFYRWLRWSPEHHDPGSTSIIEKIDSILAAAMKEDDQRGATGPWVALMGFSQGAKVCASLLLRQQIRKCKLNTSATTSAFQFAILFAGSAPLVNLDMELTESLALVDANELTTGTFTEVSGTFMQGDEHVLHLPTVHVHGTKDPGLWKHRQLLAEYCKPGSTRLVEWDGEHRLPLQTDHVAAIATQILDVARETGVIDN